jgi:carbon monoxide dehydrogenase subunit G
MRISREGDGLYLVTPRKVKAMHLEFSGAPLISASRMSVWQRLLDPAFLARSVPGVESVEALDSTHFRVISGIGVGVLKVRFAMEVRLYDIVEGQSARMSIQGRAPGSTIAVASSLRVEGAGEGSTQLHWSATAQVKGSIAGVGRQILRVIADRLTNHFWTDFARRVGEGSPSNRKVQIFAL